MKLKLFFTLSILSLGLLAQENQHITLSDIIRKGTYREESAPGLRSMNDGEHYTQLENNVRITKNSYKTGEQVAILFDITKIKDAPFPNFSEYRLSSDEKKILFTTNIKRIYRHSYSADYYIWNSVTEELTPLSENGAQQEATFSPDGNYVAFARNNNLFLKNLKFGSESRITLDGKENEIINGTPDWVYEEEFGFSKAFWWSPDSKFIAYLRFDETEVPEYSMTLYAGDSPLLEENKLYPGEKTLRYPKAGEKNSTVSVKTFELYSRVTMDIKTGDDSDIYIPGLTWTPDADELVIVRLNRRQNQLDLLYANPYTGDSRPVLTEKNRRYIDESFSDNLQFLEDGRFVIISERDGWSHLYLYDHQGFELTRITQGEFDVTHFYGYDPQNKIFYYQAAKESPLQREVYFTDPDKKTTGKLSEKQGTNNAVFSKNFAYYVNDYSNANTPGLTTVHETRKNTMIRVLQDNTMLRAKLEKEGIPRKQFFKLNTSQGVELNGYMIMPPGFNESQSYPALITQYSGPGSQKVRDSWDGITWEHYLAMEGFLIVSADPRGTAARGEEFKKATYMNLGLNESDDMIETAKFLGSLPYVDKSRIGIFGSSYGGFMTCLTMGKGGDLFKAGIAVAPVTDWRFYDTVYTERYMQKPDENPDGYDECSALTHAGNIKGRLLIIHGSADDNVHVQNTFEFTEKLVQTGVQFDMAIYTNRAHSITGGNTRMHLYTKMTGFLKENLK
ncbi:MAG: S9 family peptidase [Prolixibacteraceae bacterium]|nr:S9 family peptidase [Prolixibacteraceae bacterium]